MDASSSVPGGTSTSFVVLSVSVVGILATALLLLSYYLFLTRCGLLFFWRSNDHRHRDVVDHHHHHLHIVVREEEEQAPRRGLQGAAIRRIPTFRYQPFPLQVLREERTMSKSDCAVCLTDFQRGERLRLLPACRHAFHIDCIDAWLQTNANCPLCRATVLSDHCSVPVPRQGFGNNAPSTDDIVSESHPSSPPSSEQQQQQPTMGMRARRSLSMDSSTDKRFYLALQRMLQRQQHQDHQDHHQHDEEAKSTITGSRSLRHSFFSFSHSRTATILPL